MASLWSRGSDLHRIGATGPLVEREYNTDMRSLSLLFCNESALYPLVVDPRTTSLGFAYFGPVSHTSQQLPSRLGPSSLTLHLSVCFSSLPTSLTFPRNPFNCRRRQKRGSTSKKTSTFSFSHDDDVSWRDGSQDLSIVDTTQRIRNRCVFFCVYISLKWLTEMEDASIRTVLPSDLDL